MVQNIPFTIRLGIKLKKNHTLFLCQINTLELTHFFHVYAMVLNDLNLLQSRLQR